MLLPGSINDNSSARYQFHSKIFPQRIKEDILNQTMHQVIMPPFGGALGLPHANPVGGFVAGTAEAVFFHKGLKQIDGLSVDSHPVKSDSPGIHSQKFGGKALD